MQGEGLKIRPYQMADAAWITSRHQALYKASDGFDSSFGPLVASYLKSFGVGKENERGWVLQAQGTDVGSVFCIDGSENWAQLRMFFVEPGLRGFGAGQFLFDTCRRFAKDQGFEGMFLWTHQSHHAACRLYRKNGLVLTKSRPVNNFGQELIEQRYQIKF